MRENNVIGFVTFDLIYLLPNDPIIIIIIIYPVTK